MGGLQLTVGFWSLQDDKTGSSEDLNAISPLVEVAAIALVRFFLCPLLFLGLVLTAVNR